jgi:hypothetical protein
MAETPTVTSSQGERISLRDFLINVPPGDEYLVSSLAGHPALLTALTGAPRVQGAALLAPEIALYCNDCDHQQNFVPTNTVPLTSTDEIHTFLHYRCRNCHKGKKDFAVVVQLDSTPDLRNVITGRVRKVGEHPPFGPPMPRRLQALLGDDDWGLLLKGRRAENQGLGIGAMAYYRRVVENQKHQILGEIVRVAERLGLSESRLAVLKAARQETQFDKAVKMVKDALPEALLLRGGHNPLTLLHGALSEHLHDRTDQACVDLATDVREVLTHLAVRMGEMLEEQRGLDRAVSRLLSDQGGERQAPPAGKR